MKAAFFAILQRLLTYIVAKVFIALGISFVTFTGFTVGLGFIKDYVKKSVQLNAIRHSSNCHDGRFRPCIRSDIRCICI